MRSLPWQNCRNWTPFCSGEKISPRAILTIYTRERRARMAQFFLKIYFLVQHMGTSPRVKMASRYGLHPWLWLLLWAISLTLVPWEFQKLSQRTFSDTLICLAEYLTQGQKSNFFPMEGRGIGDLAKNDKILKSFSLDFVPRKLAVSKNSLGADFYAQITIWQTINVFTLTPTLILTSSLGHFFVSGPLRVPKGVLEEVFGHWFFWHLFYEYLPGVQKSNFLPMGWYWRFSQKLQKFDSRRFSLVLSTGKSACRKTSFYAQIMSWRTINVLTLTLTSPLSHFFVSGPLEIIFKYKQSPDKEF